MSPQRQNGVIQDAQVLPPFCHFASIGNSGQLLYTCYTLWRAHVNYTVIYTVITVNVKLVTVTAHPCLHFDRFDIDRMTVILGTVAHTVHTSNVQTPRNHVASCAASAKVTDLQASRVTSSRLGILDASTSFKTFERIIYIIISHLVAHNAAQRGSAPSFTFICS